jgi:hypothetical protein
MQKYLPFLIALFLSAHVTAQNVTEKNKLTWSQSLSNNKKATYNKFIGENEVGLFVTKTTIKHELRGNNKFPTLEVYDKNLNLVKSQNLDIKEGKGKILYENTVLIKDNLYLFYSLVYVWNQSVTLMVQPLDTKTLLPVGEPKKALETEIPIFTKQEQVPGFEFNFSDDNLSLLVSFIEPVGGNKNQKVHLYVLNSHIDQGWGKAVELPYQAKMFETVNRSIDNHGNVYLLGAKYRDGKADKKKGKPNYDYVLMGYSADGTPSFSHNIIADKFFRDMQVAVSPKSEIICTGFYSNDGEGFRGIDLGGNFNVAGTYTVDGSTPVAGVYYLRLDMDTKSILRESYSDFSIDFITQNMDKKDAKKAVRRTNKGKDNGAFSFNLEDLIIREDGGVTLIGEQSENATVTTVKPAQPDSKTGATYIHQKSTSRYYSYMDIIAVHLSPEGELEWAEKIAKKQNTVSDFGFFSSYAMAVEKDQLHFIFNENRQNLHYNGKGALANFNPRKDRKNSALAIVTLDLQGNQSKKHLAQPSNSIVLIKPSTSRQFSSESLYLFGQYKKDFRLARLEF